nr:cuticle protein 7-like [Penaeus vannamei]
MEITDHFRRIKLYRQFGSGIFTCPRNVADSVLVLAVLVPPPLARPDSPPTYGYSAPTPSYAPAKYDFNYAVNDPPSGNDFGHQEARDGDHTQGSYYVLLPDGRLQKVTYTVNGDSGYVADVTYEGEAQYPPHKPLMDLLSLPTSHPPPPTLRCVKGK